jgi:hypothetical protein
MICKEIIYDNNKFFFYFSVCFIYLFVLFIVQECFATCPVNYGGGSGPSGIQMCLPLECSGRSPNTPTLCLVYEDIDGEIDCLKISDSECSLQCPLNLDPVPSLQGGTCVVSVCDNRVPIGGTCVMAGDSTSNRCYSLIELQRCYSVCPQLTTPNITVSSNPKCEIISCNERIPDSRGICVVETNEMCYVYQGACYSVCPELTTPAIGESV